MHTTRMKFLFHTLTSKLMVYFENVQVEEIPRKLVEFWMYQVDQWRDGTPEMFQWM